MKHRIAVVTPYYKEADDVLRQCHDSVLGQTYPCDHIVVADGHPNRLFDGAERTLHVTLPRAHGDNGNTPRGIGSLLADTYGYDAVAYLDADNWFAAEHIATMVAAHEKSGGPVIGCKRTFHALDGTPMSVSELDEDAHRHIDTSCFVVFRPAFEVFKTWAMPKELGPICDRIFLQKILHSGFNISLLSSRTVAFRTQYADHYRQADMPLPDGAKEAEDVNRALRYLNNKANVNRIVERIGFYPVLG
jgi:glycosyltransferase involved in cell wall biosynthesis